MTDGPRPRVTKAEAIRNAGRIYGQILADPERAAQIRATREKYDAEGAAAAEGSRQKP